MTEIDIRDMPDHDILVMLAINQNNIAQQIEQVIIKQDANIRDIAAVRQDVAVIMAKCPEFQSPPTTCESRQGMSKKKAGIIGGITAAIIAIAGAITAYFNR